MVADSQEILLKNKTGFFWYVCTVALISCPPSSLRRANVNWATAWVIDLHTKEKLNLNQDNFCLQSSYCKAFPGSCLSSPRPHPELNLLQIYKVNLCRRGKVPKLCMGVTKKKKKILLTTHREVGENLSLRPVIDNTVFETLQFACSNSLKVCFTMLCNNNPIHFHWKKTYPLIMEHFCEEIGKL